jgi:hypothetical protein
MKKPKYNIDKIKRNASRAFADAFKKNGPGDLVFLIDKYDGKTYVEISGKVDPVKYKKGFDKFFMNKNIQHYPADTIKYEIKEKIYSTNKKSSSIALEIDLQFFGMGFFYPYEDYYLTKIILSNGAICIYCKSLKGYFIMNISNSSKIKLAADRIKKDLTPPTETQLLFPDEDSMFDNSEELVNNLFGEYFEKRRSAVFNKNGIHDAPVECEDFILLLEKLTGLDLLEMYHNLGIEKLIKELEYIHNQIFFRDFSTMGNYLDELMPDDPIIDEYFNMIKKLQNQTMKESHREKQEEIINPSKVIEKAMPMIDELYRKLNNQKVQLLLPDSLIYSEQSDVSRIESIGNDSKDKKVASSKYKNHLILIPKYKTGNKCQNIIKYYDKKGQLQVNEIFQDDMFDFIYYIIWLKQQDKSPLHFTHKVSDNDRKLILKIEDTFGIKRFRTKWATSQDPDAKRRRYSAVNIKLSDGLLVYEGEKFQLKGDVNYTLKDFPDI